MGISAAIYGCSGPVLLDEEREFFKQQQPWGFILFGRNIETPGQVSELVASLKECVAHDPVPVLIDQEGGRVRRLRPPHWPDYHSATAIGDCYRKDESAGLRMAWLQSYLMALDLRKLGINVDCLPVLDVPVPGSHDVIGDRAYSIDPDEVMKLGGAAAQGLLDGGVLPVIKHIPGHGRAGDDSHKALPKVSAKVEHLLKTDFVPFTNLSHLPLAMTAHVVYEDVDPDAPATTSRKVIEEIIRGEIGFDGLLMCDDLAMHALSGDFASRTHSAFAAGCDVVLHCNGLMEQMTAVSAAVPTLEGIALERAERAVQRLENAEFGEEEALREEFAALGEAGQLDRDPTEVLT